ncbi:methyltransferase [Burkholderia pseudomallei]|uniref:methyltransferase n=1 Tax=Burkholderia pseudomallei TaxID=28450 RepID=UPI000975E192|nr:methyltransferase [Burkholderia pseudomallei]OMS76061.1 methyltransferase [Burkholderia pseudomallei]CAJ2792587.1 methyltransferase [Burkholderia pseudomallei]CAJ8459242.1 methyltransferase [Burkholderia pseudomallei]VBE82484.1 methyltransferase [Burkholderia pseudomallei]VBV65952.1 methyltransferase [Burkholderia pseudomallei]
MTEVDAGQTPHAAILQMVTGKWHAQALYVAAELGIADLLAQRERTADELAAETQTHPEALYRVLRALGSLGVFVEEDGRRFRNSPLGDTLRRDASGSMRGFVRFAGMDAGWRAWGQLMYSVRTGRSAFEHVVGGPGFAYIDSHPEIAAIVNDAMTSMSELEAPAVARAYDFSQARTIVDVGGGHGFLLATLLRANPHANGVLFELPHACEGARQLFAKRGLTERVKVIAGDASQSIGAHGDVFVMKHVICDWDDEQATRIMTNCAEAMRPGGKLLLVEAVLTPPGEPHFAKLHDLEMLIMSSGGHGRTADGYGRLYAAAGLTMTAVRPTQGMNSVIEGVKP